MCDEMERSLHDALCVVKRVLESKSVVPGGGAVEAALSIYLENYATSMVRTSDHVCLQEGTGHRLWHLVNVPSLRPARLIVYLLRALGNSLLSRSLQDLFLLFPTPWQLMLPKTPRIWLQS